MPPTVPITPDRIPPSVAVLEWICGGGMLDTATPDQIPPGLKSEGAAMLLTIVEGLATAGVEVLVPLDVRLFEACFIDRISKCAQVIRLDSANSGEVDRVWEAVSQSTTWTWLVAPEIDDRLATLACQLRRAGGQLINASQEFLANASDKLRTACRLKEAGIAHPPTVPLLEVDDQWLNSSAQLAEGFAQLAPRVQGSRRIWCVKPADGAGGEGLKRVTTFELLQLREQLASCRTSLPRCPTFPLIVQPWIAGIPASCSAFVDARGHTQWLPLVSQDFEANKACATCNADFASRHYRGCTLPAPGIGSSVPLDLLNRTIKAMQGTAMGWIGVDLLFNPQTKQWWVMEVNPRCTSSMVGLVQAYQGNLVGDLCHWISGREPVALAAFENFIFRIGNRARE